MSKNYKILALSPEAAIGLRAQIDQYETNAFAVLDRIKTRYILWSELKKKWPTFAPYTPYRSLLDLTGSDLYNQNEALQAQTYDFLLMLAKLIKGDLRIIGYSTDNGQTIQLGTIDAKKYDKIRRAEGLAGILAFGVFVIVAATVAIAAWLANRHLEHGLNALDKANEATDKANDLQFLKLYNDMKQTDPAKAAIMLDWWQHKKDAAAQVDHRSLLDRAADTLKTIGVSGFGGLALGLFLAIYLGRPQRQSTPFFGRRKKRR